MNEEIMNAEKYLSGRLAECMGRPGLHRHTIEVYNNYLKILKERPQDYVQEVGDMFAVMQAEQLDRNEDFIVLYKKFSQEERVRAYTIRAKAVQGSSGYGDFYSRNSNAQKETEPLITLEYRKRELLSNIMRGIVAWKVALEPEKDPCGKKVTGYWNSLKGLDPGLDWQRIREFPPYRNCLYYNEEQINMLENWFREISR
jgi:hypothetical protein